MALLMLLACSCSKTDTTEIEARLAKVEARLAELESPKKAEPKKPEISAEDVRALEHELAALEIRISSAVDSVVAAENDADRAAANAKLKRLQLEQANLESRLAPYRPSVSDKLKHDLGH
jgi:hypothetical protein